MRKGTGRILERDGTKETVSLDLTGVELGDADETALSASDEV